MPLDLWRQDLSQMAQAEIVESEWVYPVDCPCPHCVYFQRTCQKASPCMKFCYQFERRPGA